MKKAVVILVILVIAGLVGWRLSTGKQDDGASKYRTATIDQGNITATVTASGTVSAVTTVQVGSQVSGVIAALYADFNSRVHKGQLLAELDPTPFQAQVEQRKADLTRAEVDAQNSKITLDRQQRLVDQGLAAQADLDGATATYKMAQAQVALAKASLTQAQTNLAYTRIRSPIDGIVVARQYDIGQTVAASFQAPTLFTIAQDLTKMQVQADVDQADIGRVEVGQPAEFTVDAYPDRRFRGKISQIRLNADVNQNVVTYPVIIEVPNPDERLRPTMTANITIDVATVSDVLRIPNSALRFRPEGESAMGRGGPAAAGSQRPAGSAETGQNGGARQTSFERNAAGLGQRAAGMAGASKVFDAATRKVKQHTQTVYLLRGDKLVPEEIRAGISDGRYTEIVSGDLEPGEKIVIGIATARASDEHGPMSFGRRR